MFMDQFFFDYFVPLIAKEVHRYDVTDLKDAICPGNRHENDICQKYRIL